MRGIPALAIRRQQELRQVAALAADLAGCDTSVISTVEAGDLRPLVAVGVVLGEREPVSTADTFCGAVQRTGWPMIVPDIHADPRFANPNICRFDRMLRFYIGVPIFGPEGDVLGVLAVLDHTVRQEDCTEIVARLERLAQLAATLLDIAEQRDLFRTQLAEAALMRDIHAALVDQASLPGALKAILRSIMQVTQAAYAQVWEMREDAWMAHQMAFETLDPADEINLRSLRSAVAIPLEELAISDMFTAGRGQVICHTLDPNTTNRQRVQTAMRHGIKCLIISSLLTAPRRFVLLLGMRNLPQNLDRQMAQVSRISVATRPILVSKLAHEQLHLLGSALAATQDGVILFKTSHPPGTLRIAYTNSAFSRMTLHQQADIIGASPFILPDPNADPEAVSALRWAVTNGQQGHAVLLMRRRDGTRFWADITLVPLLSFSDPDEHFVAVIRDVTQIRANAEAQLQRERELRATAEALQLRTEQLSRAQQIARLGTWRLQPGRDVVTWSDSVFGLFNKSPDTFIPTISAILELIHHEDRNDLRQRYEGWLSGVGPESEAMEFRVQLPDGQVRHLWSDSTCEVDNEGRVVAIGGIIQDITERREAQAMLLHAEKLRTIGQITGGVAHDFNNLLTVVSINLEMIGLLLGPDHPAEEMRSMAVRAAGNGAELISNLLAFARRQPLNPVPVALDELLSSLSKLASSSLGERHAIRVCIEGKLPPCMVDRSGLESALLNLLVNSRDAMPEGGLIELVASPMLVISKPNAHPKPTQILLKPGHYVRIEVIDHGVGIPFEIQEMVFEPFFTTKAVGKGTGLGLSSVIGFIRQSGGDVELQSRPGEGTTMRLFLPALTSGED